jgi:hypothetical protein
MDFDSEPVKIIIHFLAKKRPVAKGATGRPLGRSFL